MSAYLKGVQIVKSQQLVDIIKERLGEQQFNYTFDEKHDKLRLDHQLLQKGMDISIGEVLAKYEIKKEAAIDEIIYTIEQTFIAMQKEQEQGFEGLAQVYPVIRSTSFPKQSKEGSPFVLTEHTAETNIYYALDLGTTYRLIDEAMLEKLQVTAEQVREVARFSVKKLPTETKVDEVAGSLFYFINHNDGYDASRILNDKFLAEMRDKIEGDMTVSVPHQDVLIIGDIRSEVGYDVLAQLTMHYFTVGMVPITSLSFVYEDGKLAPIFIMAKNKVSKEQEKK